MRYLLAVLVLAGTPFATAGLLVNPAGGSSVGFPVNTDDASVFRSLGGTFPLFGFGIQSIGISSNGFLGTGGNTAGFNTFLDTDLSGLVTATNGPVIAPFFDDLFIRAGSTVTDQSVANTFYAVTYQSMFQPGDATPGHTSDFQVVLFMADTTVGAFHFLPGDIAFSYGTLATTIRGETFTVGVASNTDRRGAPGSPDGLLSSFSTLPTGSQFLLFRAPASEPGDYHVSVEDTGSIPEPTTLALVALGLIGFSLQRRYKREAWR